MTQIKFTAMVIAAAGNITTRKLAFKTIILNARSKDTFYSPKRDAQRTIKFGEHRVAEYIKKHNRKRNHEGALSLVFNFVAPENNWLVKHRMHRRDDYAYAMKCMAHFTNVASSHQWDRYEYSNNALWRARQAREYELSKLSYVPKFNKIKLTVKNWRGI